MPVTGSPCRADVTDHKDVGIDLFREFYESLKRRVERDLVPTYSYMGVEWEHYPAAEPRSTERYVVCVRWRHQSRTDCIFHPTSSPPYMLNRLDANNRHGTDWLPVDGKPLWVERLPEGRTGRRVTSDELARDLVARFKEQLHDDPYALRGFTG